MALVLETKKFWLFEGWLGGFVEVSKAKYPTYVQAIARAREKSDYSHTWG